MTHKSESNSRASRIRVESESNPRRIRVLPAEAHGPPATGRHYLPPLTPARAPTAGPKASPGRRDPSRLMAAARTGLTKDLVGPGPASESIRVTNMFHFKRDLLPMPARVVKSPLGRLGVASVAGRHGDGPGPAGPPRHRCLRHRLRPGPVTAP